MVNGAGGRRTAGDVGGRADGVQWLKRFPRAGLAQTWREQLQADFAAGLPFDLEAKRFVAPQVPTGPAMPSVFDLTEAYYRQHPDWEPKTKMAAARSLNRARRLLLAANTQPTGDVLQAVDDYLDHASFLPEHMADQLTEHQSAGKAWLRSHSAPAGSLSPAQVDELMGLFEVNQRNAAKRVSAATLTRFLQPLRGVLGLGSGP